MGLTGNRLSQQKWSVESVHSKNLVAILHLLVSLARHFRAPIRLPENVTVNVVIVQVIFFLKIFIFYKTCICIFVRKAHIKLISDSI